MMRRPAALATLAVVAALLLSTAAPATAAPPVVTFSEPEQGALFTSPDLRINGRVEKHDLDRVTGSITAVVITVSAPGGSSECSNCWTANGPDATFSWTRGLDFNGPYSVTVKATSNDLVAGPESNTATRRFNVEVPPAAPRDVKVDVGPDRRVTISWARNTEPDLRQYQVQRLAPGGSATTTIATVPQPPSGARVTAVDEQVPPAGGDYRYVVVAVRPDRDGRVTSRATARSSPVGVEIAGAPGDAAPGGDAPGPAPGSGPVRAPAGRGAGAGVSSLLSGIGSPPTSVLAVPDEGPLEAEDGFSLPGGEASSASADPAVLDDSQRVLNRRALFIPLAAGLFLCVLAFHLREFSRNVLAPPPAYHPVFEQEGGGGAGREPRTRVVVGAHGMETPEPRSRE